MVQIGSEMDLFYQLQGKSNSVFQSCNCPKLSVACFLALDNSCPWRLKAEMGGGTVTPSGWSRIANRLG